MILRRPSKEHNTAERIGLCCKNAGSSAPWNTINLILAIFYANQIEITIEIRRTNQIMPERGVGRFAHTGMAGKQPGFSVIKNGSRMKGEKAMHAGKIQKEKANCMKNMITFFLIHRLTAVNAHIMPILCHSGFKYIGHLRKNYPVHILIFIKGQFTILNQNISRRTP